MLSFLRDAGTREPSPLPLFPLKTVLFPGGVLPLKVFEQRYISMTKACLKDDRPFGVCLLTQGEEVAGRGEARIATEFAPIGTLARITNWDMPQLGILHPSRRWRSPRVTRRCPSCSSCSSNVSGARTSQPTLRWATHRGSATASRSCCPCRCTSSRSCSRSTIARCASKSSPSFSGSRASSSNVRLR
jgi:hypothetical protein